MHSSSSKLVYCKSVLVAIFGSLLRSPLSSEQNVQDLLSSARALLRKRNDHYVASTVYFNPDLTAAEAKVAFEQRQKRWAAKILEQGNGTTSAESDTYTTAATALSQAMTSTSTLQYRLTITITTVTSRLEQLHGILLGD